MLTEGTTRLHESLGGDLLLLSSFSPSLLFRFSFPRAYLYQAAAVEGVASASPVYIGRANWVNPNQLSRPGNSSPQTSQQRELFGNEVRIIAFNPAQPVLNLPEVNQQLAKLSAPDAVLFDRLSQPSLGEIPQLFGTREELATLMDNRRTYVVGLFNLGSTLNDQGNVIMSDWNYAERNGSNSLNTVRVGVLTLEKGAKKSEVLSRLRASLPKDVAAYTHDTILLNGCYR